MLNHIVHNATITVQLPCYLGANAEIAALRAAGVPVDELGNATSGYLFVRTTGRAERRTNTFRWFATSPVFVHAAPPPRAFAPGNAPAT